MSTSIPLSERHYWVAEPDGNIIALPAEEFEFWHCLHADGCSIEVPFGEAYCLFHGEVEARRQVNMTNHIPRAGKAMRWFGFHVIDERRDLSTSELREYRKQPAIRDRRNREKAQYRASHGPQKREYERSYYQKRKAAGKPIKTGAQRRKEARAKGAPVVW